MKHVTSNLHLISEGICVTCIFYEESPTTYVLYAGALTQVLAFRHLEQDGLDCQSCQACSYTFERSAAVSCQSAKHTAVLVIWTYQGYKTLQAVSATPSSLKRLTNPAEKKGAGLNALTFLRLKPRQFFEMADSRSPEQVSVSFSEKKSNFLVLVNLSYLSLLEWTNHLLKTSI